MSVTDRDKYFNEAMREAFSKLSPEEQEKIDEIVQQLRNKCDKLGITSALELIVKLSIFDTRKTNELSTMLMVLETKGTCNVYNHTQRKR